MLACSVSALFIIVMLLTNAFLNNSNLASKELIQKEVTVIENGIYRQINNNLNKLRRLVTSIEASPQISRADFHLLVQEIDQ